MQSKERNPCRKPSLGVVSCGISSGRIGERVTGKVAKGKDEVEKGSREGNAVGWSSSEVPVSFSLLKG